MTGNKKNKSRRALNSIIRHSNTTSRIPTSSSNTEEKTITETLKQLRNEEARRKGISLDWSKYDFHNSNSLYIHQFDFLENNHNTENFSVGPRTPSSWLTNSILRPKAQDVERLFETKSLYTHCLKMIFAEFELTEYVLSKIHLVSPRLKLVLMQTLLPKFSEPDRVLLLFKDVSYERLSLKNLRISSSAIIKFLGKPVSFKKKLVDDWEDLLDPQDQNPVYPGTTCTDLQPISHLKFLTFLDLTGCQSLNLQLSHHLSKYFSQLIFLNLTDTYHQIRNEEAIVLLNELGSGLTHLRSLIIDNNEWLNHQLLLQRLSWSSFVFPSLSLFKAQNCKNLEPLEDFKTEFKSIRPNIHILV